jgi:hypothetical protein
VPDRKSDVSHYHTSPIESAVATVVNSLRGNGTNFGMLWFDVEQCTGCWNDNASNQQFLQRAINQAAKMGVRVGIYSNLNEWAQTLGRCGKLLFLSFYAMIYLNFYTASLVDSLDGRITPSGMPTTTTSRISMIVR